MSNPFFSIAGLTLPDSVSNRDKLPAKSRLADVAIADEKGRPMPLCGGASPNPQHSSELAAANATSSVRHYPTTNSGNG